jgi:hypothetical protein
MTQEPSPALEIFLLALGDTENLPITVRADADRHQHRDILHLTGPAALQNHPVEVQIRELARDLAVAPSLNMPVDLLVEPRDRA